MKSKGQTHLKRKQLSLARMVKQWTQAQAAERLGVDINTLSRWENGISQPHPIHIQRLCEVYGATAVDLGLQEPFFITEAASLPTALLEESKEQENDPSLSQLLREDMTLRLLKIVWLWPRRNTQYYELQQFIMRATEEYDTMNQDKSYSVGRREALRRLALLPLELCGLSALGAVLTHPVEEILTQCAAGITACWYLHQGKEPALASLVISSYLPTLHAIVKTSSATQRKIAADLLVQCYLLKAKLARHVDGSNEALTHVQNAVKYSQVTENPMLHILALRTLAATHYYAQQWELALHVAEQTQHLLEHSSNTPIPHLVYSYVYAGLATYQACSGKEQEAQASLKHAHTTFLAQSANEPIPIWIDHSQANLQLNDGMTHFHLGLQKEALKAFSQIDTLPQDELGRIEVVIDSVVAEIYRDDTQRDMYWCIEHWIKAIEGAKLLQSDQRFQEAVQAHTAMRIAWPTEKRIKDLRELVVHW